MFFIVVINKCRESNLLPALCLLFLHCQIFYYRNQSKKTPNSVCVQIIQNASLFFATEYDYSDIHKLTANQVEYGIHDNLSNRVLGRDRNIFLPFFYRLTSNLQLQSIRGTKTTQTIVFSYLA